MSYKERISQKKNKLQTVVTTAAAVIALNSIASSAQAVTYHQTPVALLFCSTRLPEVLVRHLA